MTLDEIIEGYEKVLHEWKTTSYGHLTCDMNMGELLEVLLTLAREIKELKDRLEMQNCKRRL